MGLLTKSKPAVRRLADRIVLAAAARPARLLKPFPEGSDLHEVNAVLEDLRRRGLVHADGPDPNLTVAGIDYARGLQS